MSSDGFKIYQGPPAGRPDVISAPLRNNVVQRSVYGETSFQDVGSGTLQRADTDRSQVSPGRPRTMIPESAAGTHIKRSSTPYFPSPDEIMKKSRASIDALSDFNSTDESYMLHYQPRSPPVSFQKNLPVGGQFPHTVVTQKPQSPSSIWNNRTTFSHNFNLPAQGTISPVSITGSRPMFKTKHEDSIYKKTKSATISSTTGISLRDADLRPYGDTSPSRNVIDYRDLDAPKTETFSPLAVDGNSSRQKSLHHSVGTERHLSSSPVHVNLSKPPISVTSSFTKSERSISNEDIEGVKQTSSATTPSAGMHFIQNPAVSVDQQRMYDRRHAGLQSERPSLTSGYTEKIGGMNNQQQFAGNTAMPFISSSEAFQERLDYQAEVDRELHAKAKRLARFRDELNQPVQGLPTMRNQNYPPRSQYQMIPAQKNLVGDPTVDVIEDTAGVGVSTDNDGLVSSSAIVGLCSDMCPESERAERERKGDLDQYERLDGDRNLTSKSLAVKKYNRTADREAELIRPMPVLQMTMEYLLNLLCKPYDHTFLGLYNFLWDRMRAVRMDLRMQHIFDLEAISMLEQMIRLHIIAMHELCEHMKGEGFSEGFDAHLNIEQMNKTSVELFQLYDDHRKRGIHVPSEKEFRGYYALLKLDKHPGYKVEPAELSLDLAKMTPEIRQTSVVLFARDVARSCRTGNFIAFFRLAKNASYLQACLMHAHFSKLRTQALASLHSGLQINQGIPIPQVVKWLGMEEEDIGDLLEFYGFSVKAFEEPYLVKENSFINVDNEFPIRRSKLVEGKKSSVILYDVLYSSVAEPSSPEEAKELKPKTGPEAFPEPSWSSIAVNATPLADVGMPNVQSILSPKSSAPSRTYWTPTDVTTPNVEAGRDDAQTAVHGSSGLDISDMIPVQRQRRDSFVEPEDNPNFRNSLDRSLQSIVEVPAPMQMDMAYETKYAFAPNGSVALTPLSSLTKIEASEAAEETTAMKDEDQSDVIAGIYVEEEVVEAKLKLILRRWKRHSTKKREFREYKRIAANAALGLLPLGPPVWQFINQPCNFGALNIDGVMKKRNEVQERSFSVVNPSDVVAATLFEKNPGSNCLCWKLVLCTSYGCHDAIQNESTLPASCLWLKSKLVPGNQDNERDLIVSSEGLAIWRSWINFESCPEICCLSVIRCSTFEDSDNAYGGASAVLFLSSEAISLELRKKQLYKLIMSINSGSGLPLLILSDRSPDSSNSGTITQDLKLHEIDRSRVAKFHIAFLRNSEMEKTDGFFSDECLRKGLDWLAMESPQQIILREIKTRELVLSHLNSSLKDIDEIDDLSVRPNDCISVFNEALEQSMQDVAVTVHANPTGWPCPEIELLEQSSDEHRIASWFLPTVGWSFASRTESLMHSLCESKLPFLDDDFSWLSGGINTYDDFDNQKSRLKTQMINYLTETGKLMGLSLAQKEAGILVQNFTSLQLRDSAYYIIPKWASIFRRVFNWRLMRFSSGELSSTYVLGSLFSGQSYGFPQDVAFSHPSVAHPSLDELVQIVGCGLLQNHEEYETFRPLSAAADSDVPNHEHSPILVESDEQNGPTSDDNSATGNGSRIGPTREADRLSKLLEMCNIVQTKIEKKLSFYF